MVVTAAAAGAIIALCPDIAGRTAVLGPAKWRCRPLYSYSLHRISGGALNNGFKTSLHCCGPLQYRDHDCVQLSLARIRAPRHDRIPVQSYALW